LSKARELANVRYAKGEISKEEFLDILRRLDDTALATDKPITNDTSSNYNPLASPVGFSAHTTYPEATHHHSEKLKVRFDLSFLASSIGVLSTIIVWLYGISFFLLFKARDDLSNFSVYFEFFIATGALTEGFKILLALLYFIPELLLLIATLVWVKRGTSNLHHSQIAELDYTPAWAVGWFFIPVAFFWVPAKVMHQLFAGTFSGDNWKNSSIDSAILIWFIVYWVSTITYFLVPEAIQFESDVAKILIIYGAVCLFNGISVTYLNKFVQSISAQPIHTK